MTISSTRRVCAKCQVELYPMENGVYVLEMADFGPYKLWMADKWGCRKCGLEILTGFCDKPKHHWEEGFTTQVLALRKAKATIMEVR